MDDFLYGSSFSFYPSTVWKKSDTWGITVQLYPKEQPAVSQGPPNPLSIHVTVVGTQKVDVSDCWKVFFIPDKNAQKVIGQSYCVMVDKKTTWPRKIIRLKDPCLAAIEQRGEVSVVIGAPKGFPLEIFPLSNLQEFGAKGSGTSLKLSRHASGRTFSVEAAYKSVEGEEVVVRQRWVEGEKWWRETERFVNGRKDLHARLGISDRPASQGISGKRVRPLKVQTSATNGGRDRFYLRRDSRLHVNLNLVAKDPTVEKLLDRLGEATGLKFKVDASLSAHRPSYGEIEIRNGPAFTVMEMMEKRDLEGGQWVKIEDGYRLVGRSSGPAKSSLSTSSLTTTGPIQQPGSNATSKLLWTYFLSLGPFLVALAFLLIRRRRQTQQAATASERGTVSTTPPTT